MSSAFLQANAANAIAGAVLRAQGSRIRVKESKPIASNWSNTISACDAPETTIGAVNKVLLVHRSIVCWNKLCGPVRFKNCFGRAAVERGHNRVPDPPDKTIGVIVSISVISARSFYVAGNNGFAIG